MLGQQGLQVGLDPVLLQPGVEPEVVAGVVKTSPMEICSVSPSRPWTSHTAVRGSRQPARPDRRLGGRPCSVTVHGGLIQFSGLYARSSAWMDTEPSALTRISRVAIGRWAVSRPA